MENIFALGALRVWSKRPTGLVDLGSALQIPISAKRSIIPGLLKK